MKSIIVITLFAIIATVLANNYTTINSSIFNYQFKMLALLSKPFKDKTIEKNTS